jgi:hypothetical protein
MPSATHGAAAWAHAATCSSWNGMPRNVGYVADATPRRSPVPGEATVNLSDVRMIVAHAFECSSAVLDRAGHRWAS